MMTNCAFPNIYAIMNTLKTPMTKSKIKTILKAKRTTQKQKKNALTNNNPPYRTAPI